MSDIDTISAGQPESVDRQVRVTEQDQGPHVVTTISQVYPTTAADLWQACTSAERLPRWFAPVTGDLQLGGRYQIEGNASGTIEHCEPPTSLRVTWEFDGAVSWVDVRIDTQHDGARLTLEHSGDTPPDFWSTYGPGAGGVGWDLAFLGLAVHLATGADRPAEESQWTQSEQARRFIAASSQRWADAWIASGGEAEAAREAEARTTAFYTGQEPS